MLPRCFSFLAVIGLLASQLAARPHAHQGMTAVEQRDHAAKPHFHTAKHSHHKHSHDGQSHTHSHSLPEQPVDNGSNDTAHDESAVYCSLELDVVLLSKSVAVDADQLCFSIAAFVAIPVQLPQDSREVWHPPNTGQDGSEIFLALRNLRL